MVALNVVIDLRRARNVSRVLLELHSGTLLVRKNSVTDWLSTLRMTVAQYCNPNNIDAITCQHHGVEE